MFRGGAAGGAGIVEGQVSQPAYSDSAGLGDKSNKLFF